MNRFSVLTYKLKVETVLNNIYNPLILLLVLFIFGTPLIILLWIILYRKGLYSLRSMALSFFLGYTIIGISMWIDTRQIWILFEAMAIAVLGSLLIFLLPLFQPKLIKFLKLKL